MKLHLLPDTMAVCRLPPAAALPQWLDDGWQSVTRTPHELSIVCAAALVPDCVQCEAPWRMLEVAGPLEFSQVGVLASLCNPLAEAGISLFAVSTFDTDYLLVKSSALNDSIAALELAGHHVD